MKAQPHLSFYLEGFVDDSLQTWRTMVHSLPFLVGRRGDSDLVLPFSRISQNHAELYDRGESLWIRDLESTNGTFLNGRRVYRDQPLKDGDIVHFADHEFRIAMLSPTQTGQVTQTMALRAAELPSRLFEQSRQLTEMLRNRALIAHYQPIFRLADDETIGYELLGRGMLGGEETQPGDLFFIAECQGKEVELSTALRDHGVELARNLGDENALFVNTHPSELTNLESLMTSLRNLRERHPERSLVLEIHEAAITDPTVLQSLRSDLADLDFGIAFDDFGTGQARLLELTQVAPEYVKFDRVWVKDLDKATQQRHEMVKALVRLVGEMGVSTIAEGIERREESEACQEIGFDYGQGFFYGYPEPIEKCN